MSLRADTHIPHITTAIPPTRDMPLADVIEYILTTHHERDRTELERATALASKVHRVHAASHPELARVDALVSDLRDELLAHMVKEEQVLFPMIHMLKEGYAGDNPLACPIVCMRAEHADAATALAELRTITNGFSPPQDACGSYCALYQCLQELEEDLYVHIHLENDILFPRALELAIGRMHG